METLTFKVEGEFVCQLARQWFWEEDKPFEKCQELLIECLCTDAIGIEEKKSIAIDILEGKMILKGINTFTLEEDGERIRPLTDKIKENEKRLIICRIKDEMELYPERYVDKYACPKNTDKYEPIHWTKWDSDNVPLLGATETEMVRLWLYATENFYTGKFFLQDGYYKQDTYVDNGAYLMNAALVYEVAGDTIINTGESMFYKKLHKYWECHPKKSGIEERQLLYEAEMERDKKPPVDNLKVKWKTKSLSEIALPDEKINGKYLSEYGMIDRQGRYYSCEYAGHNTKAMSIIEKNPELFNLKKSDLYKINDRMIDILLDKGWIIVRNPSMGDTYFNMNHSIVATKSQIKAAFDYMAHFNRRSMNGLDNIMKTEN